MHMPIERAMDLVAKGVRPPQAPSAAREAAPPREASHDRRLLALATLAALAGARRRAPRPARRAVLDAGAAEGPAHGRRRRRSLEEVGVEERLGNKVPLDAHLHRLEWPPVPPRRRVRRAQAGGAHARLLRLPHAVRAHPLRHGEDHARERPRARQGLRRRHHLVRSGGEAGAGGGAAPRLPPVARAATTQGRDWPFLVGTRAGLPPARRRGRLPLRSATRRRRSGRTSPRSSSSRRTARSRGTCTASSIRRRTSGWRSWRRRTARSARASTGSSSPATATTPPRGSTSRTRGASCAPAGLAVLLALSGPHRRARLARAAGRRRGGRHERAPAQAAVPPGAGFATTPGRSTGCTTSSSSRR